MKILPSIYSVKLLIVLTLLFSALSGGFVQAQEHSDDVISQAELEQVLAPIALYPDTILSHILVASTYPLEVVQAERWSLQNPELLGQDAVNAAQENDWDPSVKALVAFPQILKRMSQDLDWTQRLGDAFLQGEEQVLASVQNLRELAQQAGSLEDMKRVTVTRDERNIIIEPREREVVYVPYYDTRVVYGPWRWQHYQPTYWGYPYAGSRYTNDYYARNRHDSFYWGPRISLSFGFFSNSFNWRNQHLVRISSRHYQPRRYYNHHDILGHRYAERWVHNANRRHGNRNRYNSRRDYSRGEDGRRHRNVRRNDQVQVNQRRQQLNQEQVRNRLVNRRSTPVVSNSSRRGVTPPNQSVANRSGAVNSRDLIRQRAEASRRALANRNRATANRPNTNSRIRSPRSDRPREDNRRVASRSATRPSTRQTTVKPNPQINRARTAPVQQRPATRPAQRQVASRPAAPRKPVAVEQATPNNTRSVSRNERRQPR